MFRDRFLWRGSLLGLVLGLVVSSPATAQPGKVKAEKTPIYFGAAACVSCHKDGFPNAILCECKEMRIWAEKDKHKDAFKVLQSPRSQRMGELLGLKPTEDKRCLSCHSVVIEDQELAKRSKEAGFDLAEGVSCVACHGAYAEWVEKHASKVALTWRKLTRAEKEEQYGMTDLWDPAKRARMCLSCHVGNAKEGKVVTHEMYAAGHPPLPSVELATFSEEMPRHWQYLSEKKPEVQKLLQYDGQLEKTKLVAVSGLVALSAAMNLLADEAAGARKGGALDLASFDCIACHHDLQPLSWRQRRGYAGTPGRPGMRDWPLTLARAATRYVGESDAPLNEQLQGLTAAFDARPFGDPVRVEAAARGIAAWADGLAVKVAQKPADQAAALQFLKELCTVPPGEVPDYDSARQRAWAFRLVYSDLQPKPANAAAIEERLRTLDAQLRLELPSGANRSIEKELPEMLRKLNDYDPYATLKTFAALRQLLGADR